MKKLSLLILVLFACGGSLFAEPGRAQVYVGAVSSGTQITIRVTTTPILALSTGTNVQYGNYGAHNYPLYTSTTVANGEVMANRVQLEFSNDTSTDVYVGYGPEVSTVTADTPEFRAANRGRRIAPSASWAHDCAIIPHWVISSTTTAIAFTITQER